MEPDERRRSRPVLGERGGEIPPRYSPQERRIFYVTSKIIPVIFPILLFILREIVNSTRNRAVLSSHPGEFVNDSQVFFGSENVSTDDSDDATFDVILSGTILPDNRRIYLND